MGIHNLDLRPGKDDRMFGYTLLACSIGFLALCIIGIISELPAVVFIFFLTFAAAFGVLAWFSFRTQKYEYKNWLGLRYLNTLHGVKWKWGEGHERITKRFHTASNREPKDSEKSGEYVNVQDVEAYGVALFIERLRQGNERIDTSSLSQEQRANFLFDLRVLGTEFQREAEKVKRTIEDSSLATQYQDLALFCQKEAKRMEQDGVISISTEVTSASVTAPQGQLEDLPNIGGSVRLVQQEGRVTELRFYGLPPGEYALTMSRQTKTIRVKDGAASVSLAELGVSPQAHGAFMIDSPDGASDAVRW